MSSAQSDVDDAASSGPGGLRVAVVGLGNLGLAVAERLRDVGHVVVGYDVSADARARATERGLTLGSSVADAASGADVSCLVVGTAAQVRACLHDLAGSDSVRLVHATLAPHDVEDLAAEHPGLLDAPVSGGPDRAREGSLAVMVGGPDDVLLRARPVLDALGRVLVTGGVGTAQVTKLIGQMVFMTTQGALLEGERLAASHGVAWPTVLDALGSGTADCWAARNWGFFDAVAADYDRSGLDPASRPWSKDLATAVAVGRSADVALPLTVTAARVVGPSIDEHARHSGSG